MNLPTWKCHICKEERPDDKISVYQRPLLMGEPGREITITMNIRYCNDRQECIEGAKTFSFFKKETPDA